VIENFDVNFIGLKTGAIHHIADKIAETKPSGIQKTTSEAAEQTFIKRRC